MNPENDRLEEIGRAEEVILIENTDGTQQVIVAEEVLLAEAAKPTHHGHHHHHEHLFIFVNRRKFTKAEGVKQTMTGAEIAALVSVPADKAVIKREQDGHATEIGTGQSVTLHEGEQFLVTRKTVEGGHGA